MKKILAIVLAAMVLCVSLAGCANAPTNPSGADVDNTGAEALDYMGIPLSSDEVTLTVWESTAGADEFVIQAGKAFSQLYPNITVEFVNVELGDAKGQIALDGPAGIGPDLFASPNNTIGVLVDGGHILSSAAQDALSENLLASALTSITFGDEIYGYPIASEGYAVFYNKDLISEDELPSTFEDLVSYCETFNAENPGKYGFLMNVAEGYYTIAFCSDNGKSRLFGEFGSDPTVTNVNTDSAVEAFTWMQKNLRPVMDIPAADISQSGLQSVFLEGNAAMFVTGLWDISPIQDAGINFGIMPFPSLPGQETPPEVFTSTRVMFTSAYSEHPNEANAFALFMTSEEMQQLRFEICGSAPSIDTAVESEFMGGFLAQMDYGYPCPSISQCDYFWDAMNSASSNIWDGADVKAELDAADAAILAG